MRISDWSSDVCSSDLLGSLASGLLLFGMSLLYGATYSLDLATIHDLAGGLVGDDRVLMLTGVVFIVVGIAFKFGAAPFHMWLPDTYHGAPTPITLFIGSAPKLARSEEHTSELQSLMRISYAVFCLKK